MEKSENKKEQQPYCASEQQQVIENQQFLPKIKMEKPEKSKERQKKIRKCFGKDRRKTTSHRKRTTNKIGKIGKNGRKTTPNPRKSVFSARFIRNGGGTKFRTFHDQFFRSTLHWWR